MQGITRTRRTAGTLSGVFLYWTIGAALVLGVDRTLVSPAARVAVNSAVILVTAFAYMRLTARDPSLDHALFTGVTWLILSIVAELLLSRHLGRGWFDLLGSPDSALRNILMFAWIGAPALFARYHQ
jgi:hypothetical protein